MERISALMDGELEGRQADQAYQQLKDDAGARVTWETFHVIGDVLRGERVSVHGLSARLSERLAREPIVLEPRRRRVLRAAPYLWSAAASLSAVALVGWVAFFSPLAPQSQIASAPASAPVVAATPAVAPAQQAEIASVPSDGTMDQYLMAHQEFSPSTTLQGVAPYIRSVSASRPSRGAE